MLAKRIIPCLDIKDGETVKGVNFVGLRSAGDPIELGKAYSDQGADELVCAVDGPIVLAGLTDHDTGLKGDLNDPESIMLPEQSHTYGSFVWTQNVYMTRRQKENIRMIPLYEVEDEQYTVYFTAE